MRALEPKVPPALVGVICAASMWAIATTCSTAALPSSGIRIAAAAIAILGVGIIVAGVLSFRRHSTTVNPMTPDRAASIVMDGICRATRNPMYLGIAVILVAWATYLASIAALIVLPIFVAYMTQFQIKPEERVLRQKFGQAYTQYMANVRRWI